MLGYYNEHDPFAAAWLRELIKAGLIAPGEVDERSIEEIQPSDLRGFTQCHFFAGIGGWSYALRLAGWPDECPTWTGSCPCQPLSVAGSRQGHADRRHLWPTFYRLIAECRPPVVFGEQVASKDGREWFAAVRADLEGVGYACGGADLCAASVGAPHIRQRLFWVADTERYVSPAKQQSGTTQEKGRPFESEGRDSYGGGLALPGRDGLQGLIEAGSATGAVVGSGAGGVGNSESGGLGTEQPRQDFWRDCDWLPCRDGKARPVEPGVKPLAHGVHARVGRLRGYGNAIVPQVAQAFIETYREIVELR